MKSNDILITGGSGFIGDALIKELVGHNVSAITRNIKQRDNDVNWIEFDLENLLKGNQISGTFNTVVHLAAKVHSSEGSTVNTEVEYNRINCELTLELARQLSVNGMNRFVFISSIGVNGSETFEDEVFMENSTPKPETVYARSKLNAEIKLKQLAKELDFELVIIRPPLVYGKGAPGNFGKLIDLVKRQLPLPFGMVHNSKSYISVTNLSSFISLCCSHPKAANQTFLIADDGYISTRNLLIYIRNSLNVKFLLIPVPKFLLLWLFRIIGKEKMSVQLIGDLKIDNSKAKRLLNWHPVETIKEALTKIH